MRRIIWKMSLSSATLKYLPEGREPEKASFRDGRGWQSMFSKEYASKDIDEQLRYMETFFFLLCLKDLRKRGRAGRDDIEAAIFDNAEWLVLEGRKPSSLTDEDIRELEGRKREFEARLKDSPKRYPMGAFFKAHRLNAMERYVVTAVASTILFGDDFGKGISEIDLRRLARLYHDSPRKRLEAEFYFTGGCKLLQRRILRIEDGKHAGMLAPAAVKLDIHPRAYRAVMGRSEPAVDCGPRQRPRRPSRDEEERNPGELIEPRIGLERVVLPSATLEEIRSALILEHNRGVLFDSWGLGDQMARGRGVSMLFSGPPGTGKTLAAEAVAYELERKLLCVAGSDLVCKWHGEEERNAAAVFRRAEKEDAILFFDEADSFFYARHDVNHSTDVSDNRTVNIILACLENHTLPVILTTNRANALEPALERRLSLKIHFRMPGPEERERIWRLHLPDSVPLAEGVDITALAERYELAGGNIKNVVLSAARRAIARAPDVECAEITMQDLERACRDEKEGKGFSEGMRRKVGFLA